MAEHAPPARVAATHVGGHTAAVPPGSAGPGSPYDSNPAESRGHEHGDMRLPAYLWFIFWFAVIGAIIHAVVWWMFVTLQHRDQRMDAQLPPLASQRQPPPEPRLQPLEDAHPNLPVEDLRQMANQEHAALNSYGWSAVHPGAVRIPIDRAMDLVVQRGLPASTRPATEPAGGGQP